MWKHPLALAALAATAAAGPCDIYDAAGTPCVAAHSTTRALYSTYDGPLYVVQKLSNNVNLSTAIWTLGAGGKANANTQDSFCSGPEVCTIVRIIDQSPQGNHLDLGPAGPAGPIPDKGTVADKLPLTLGGSNVYAAYFEGKMGFRNDNTTGIATGDEPESMYMVTSGRHYNGGCCFDYGNAETDHKDDGQGTMEAIYFGNSTGWGKGAGNGPWVMADLENGLWAGTERVNANNTPMVSEYVTAMVKGKAGSFSLRGGDAQQGKLTKLFDGARPAGGYNPMRKQGAIILGIGGDNSYQSIGTFYEGVMTQGFSTDATDNAVQANIVAAGYGK